MVREEEDGEFLPQVIISHKMCQQRLRIQKESVACFKCGRSSVGTTFFQDFYSIARFFCYVHLSTSKTQTNTVLTCKMGILRMNSLGPKRIYEFIILIE